jgi:hypothetical protein
MHIGCLIGKHQAVPSTLWNDGHFFSKCRHCECDMISQGGPWQPVPKGYAVKWRPRTEIDARWDQRLRSASVGLKLSDMLIGYALNPEQASSGAQL